MGTTTIEEKRKPTVIQARPSVMRQARIACYTQGWKFPEWLDAAMVAAIPPAFRKDIGSKPGKG
jgi:hypothetical protein